MSPPVAMPGRIGNYEVRRLIGAGGIGRVHAGYDPALNREVAIKSLRPELTTDAGLVERFRAEAASLARLNHPNITTLYALVPQGRDLHMVMELVRGDTLETLLARRGGPLDVKTALALVAQAGEGLAYAHAAGVVHRDIKPANLMVTESGLLKIMDFGIARVEGSQRLTRDGSIVGTLAYMSPEQLRGGEGDARSDLYSLAVVLYEMLAGRVPFRASSDYELMRAQIEQPPPRLASAVPGLSRSVEAAVMRALEKKPEKRFASIRAFLDALAEGTPAASATSGRLLAQALRAAPAAANGKAAEAKKADGKGADGPLAGRRSDGGGLRPALVAVLIGAAVAGAALVVLQRERLFASDPPLFEAEGVPVRPEAVPAPAPRPRENSIFVGGSGGRPAGGPDPAGAPQIRPPATSPRSDLVPALLPDGPATAPTAAATTAGPALAASAPSAAPATVRTPVAAAEGAAPEAPTAAPPASSPDPPGDLADAEIAYGKGDFTAALAIARPLAERGTAEAQFIIAKIYDSGRGGVEQNLPEAFKWYRRAAEQGLARAQFNVGRFYSLGRGGLPMNLQSAASWFAKAAAAGDMDAAFNLANLYYNGDMGPPDAAKAKELFARVMNSSSRLAPDARKAYDFIVANGGG